MKKLDHEIVCIVLKHYFCNVEDVCLDKDSTLNFYQKLIDKVNENCDIDWNELEDYIIWEPFEKTMPTYVVDNMEDLYNNVEDLLKTKQNNIISKLE